MKSIFLGCLLTASVSLLAQTSISERTGFYHLGTTWGGGTVPGTVAGETITATSKIIVVNGTAHAIHNLTYNLSILTINANDTLVVLGDFNIGGSNISNNGVLIVLGNFTNTLGNSSVSSLGKLVVTGDYDNNAGANSFTGPSYVFGDKTGFITPPAVGNEGTLNSTDPGLASFVDNILGVLPVELTHFSALATESGIRLTWHTASELNNDYFIVERSQNLTGFAYLVKLHGAGTSNEPHTYEFTDISPLEGTSYYRLRQVDFDGTTFYSEIVSVMLTHVPIEIYPNPTADYLFIGGVDENSLVLIADVRGVSRPVRFGLTELTPGRLGIDLTSMESGVYTIQIVSNGVPTSQRFVKR